MTIQETTPRQIRAENFPDLGDTTMYMDPDIAAEVFVLEPITETDPRDGYEG
jgi:hypothetical protein